MRLPKPGSLLLDLLNRKSRELMVLGSRSSASRVAVRVSIRVTVWVPLGFRALHFKVHPEPTSLPRV